MKVELIMPTIMVVCSTLASVVYFYKRDVRMGIYWASAAILTASVTY